MTNEINETHLDDICLTRIGDDSVKISWEMRDTATKVTVFASESPDDIDHRKPAATVTGSSDVSITGLDPDTRYYFDVVPLEGPSLSLRAQRSNLKHVDRLSAGVPEIATALRASQ